MTISTPKFHLGQTVLCKYSDIDKNLEWISAIIEGLKYVYSEDGREIGRWDYDLYVPMLKSGVCCAEYPTIDEANLKEV